MSLSRLKASALSPRPDSSPQALQRVPNLASRPPDGTKTLTICIAKMFLITARFLRNHRISLGEIISWLQPYNLDFPGAFGSSRILLITSSTPKQPTSGFKSIVQQLKALVYKDCASKLYRRHINVPSRPNPCLKAMGLRATRFYCQSSGFTLNYPTNTDKRYIWERR